MSGGGVEGNGADAGAAVDPSVDPSKWSEHIAPDGRAYFYNR